MSFFAVDPTQYKFLIPPYVSEHEFFRLVDQHVFPSFEGLLPAIYYAIVLSVIRYFLHMFVIKPFALYAMDLKYPDKNTYENDNETYQKKKRKVDKSITKFVEASWRFIFYSAFCIVGVRALFFPHTASWIKDTANYWAHWPQQHTIEPMVLFYYLVELGAYFHQLAWTEVTRSDAVEMIVHHLVTIMLIVFSYLLNFSRIGSVILLLHDVADVFLESAKCFNYISRAKGRQWAKTVCDVLFAIFAISFFVTRLVLFPRYVIYDVLFVSPITFNNDWFGYWTFAGLLITLECLHIFWFYLVAKMVVKLFTIGIEKDERSDDEGDDSEPVQSKAPSSKKVT